MGNSLVLIEPVGKRLEFVWALDSTGVSSIDGLK
jgi:hypothetical protein